MVDLTFHNFVSYKENVGKVLGAEGEEALENTKDWGAKREQERRGEGREHRMFCVLSAVS